MQNSQNENVRGVLNTPHYSVEIGRHVLTDNAGQTILRGIDGSSGQVFAEMNIRPSDDARAIRIAAHEIGIHVAPYHKLLEATAQRATPQTEDTEKYDREKSQHIQHRLARDYENKEYSDIVKALTALLPESERRSMVEGFKSDLVRYADSGRILDRFEKPHKRNEARFRYNHRWVKKYETKSEYAVNEAREWAPYALVGAGLLGMGLSMGLRWYLGGGAPQSV